MKIFDLLLEPLVDFFRLPKHKTGWGIRVFSPPPFITDYRTRYIRKALLQNSLFFKVNLTEVTLLITKVIIRKDKFYFENSGGQDT